MKRLLLLAALLLTGTAACLAERPDPAQIRDLGMAMEYCDLAPLKALEGIWLYPGDKVKVLIYATSETDYEARVVDREFDGPEPGSVIARLQDTPEVGYYDLRHAVGGLKRFQQCRARITAEGDGLVVTSQKLRLNFNPTGFLPYFWRVVRMSETNPIVSQAPKGLIKVYPSYDGNGSSRFNPRYL